MSVYPDYVYATPIYVFTRQYHQEDVDVFVACNKIDSEENKVIPYPEGIEVTIQEFYDALDEMDEREAKRKKG
mgnify:FL=1